MRLKKSAKSARRVALARRHGFREAVTGILELVFSKRAFGSVCQYFASEFLPDNCCILLHCVGMVGNLSVLQLMWEDTHRNDRLLMTERLDPSVDILNLPDSKQDRSRCSSRIL